MGKLKTPPIERCVLAEQGHAEGIRLNYDPAVISYTELLYVFFATHDPTTLNRQGNDVGTQYRSAIFYTDEAQKQMAKEVMTELQATTFDSPIVTELLAEVPFFSAEDEHQNYYNQHSDQMYCSYVISPKVAKLQTLF